MAYGWGWCGVPVTNHGKNSLYTPLEVNRNKNVVYHFSNASCASKKKDQTPFPVGGLDSHEDTHCVDIFPNNQRTSGKCFHSGWSLTDYTNLHTGERTFIVLMIRRSSFCINGLLLALFFLDSSLRVRHRGIPVIRVDAKSLRWWCVWLVPLASPFLPVSHHKNGDVSGTSLVKQSWHPAAKVQTSEKTREPRRPMGPWNNSTDSAREGNTLYIQQKKHKRMRKTSLRETAAKMGRETESGVAKHTRSIFAYHRAFFFLSRQWTQRGPCNSS